MPTTAMGGLAARLRKIRTQAGNEKEPDPPPDEAIEPEEDPPLAPEAEVPDPLPEDDGEDEDPHDEFQELTRGDPESLLDQILDPDFDDSSGEEVVVSDMEPIGDEFKAVLLDLLSSYYQINKSPSDDQFHALASSLGIDHEVLEAALFEMVGQAISDETPGEHVVG